MTTSTAAYMRQYYANNRDKLKQYRADWEKRRVASDPEYAAKRGKERGDRKAIRARWRRANPERNAFDCMKRLSDKLRRTPPWVDLKEIERFYAEAKELSEFTDMPWHVDHVIPLRGKKVSGLHVHTNLQLLPGVENMKKGNSFGV